MDLTKIPYCLPIRYREINSLKKYQKIKVLSIEKYGVDEDYENVFDKLKIEYENKKSIWIRFDSTCCSISYFYDIQDKIIQLIGKKIDSMEYLDNFEELLKNNVPYLDESFYLIKAIAFHCFSGEIIIIPYVVTGGEEHEIPIKIELFEDLRMLQRI